MAVYCDRIKERTQIYKSDLEVMTCNRRRCSWKRWRWWSRSACNMKRPTTFSCDYIFWLHLWSSPNCGLLYRSSSLSQSKIVFLHHLPTTIAISFPITTDSPITHLTTLKHPQLHAQKIPSAFPNPRGERHTNSATKTAKGITKTPDVNGKSGNERSLRANAIQRLD